MTIHGFVESVDAERVGGWCRDTTLPGEQLAVQVTLDGAVLATGVADAARADLVEAGFGHGRHGFVIALARELAPEEQGRVAIQARSGDTTQLLPRLPAEAVEPPREGLVSRRVPHCVLHIGTEKTGTTSLQAYLGRNRDALLGQGVLAPVSGAPHAAIGILNHTGLVAYALDISKSDELEREHGLASPDQQREYREALVAALAAEIEAAGPACHTLVVSTEYCQSRLFLSGELGRLRNLLLSLAESVSVIVYLRPQHEMAVSLVSTALRNGELDTAILAATDPCQLLWEPAVGRLVASWAQLYYDHDALVARWETTFGIDAVDVRLFGDDVVEDFIARIGGAHGIDVSALQPLGHRENAGLNSGAQRTLFVVNRLLTQMQRSEAEPLLARIASALEVSKAGSGVRPARAAAEAFQALFEESNERLRARRFPDRERLFDHDFSAYTAQGDTLEPSPEELAGALIELSRSAA